MPHMNKTSNEKWQFGSKNKSRPRKDWENHFENPRQINSKNQREIAACEQKATSRKVNYYSNTIFSLHSKIRAKTFTPQNQPLFCSTSSFSLTKKTTPI